MLYSLLFASFVLMAVSHPSGPPPSGEPPCGPPPSGPPPSGPPPSGPPPSGEPPCGPPPSGEPPHGHGPCGHHPPGPPKCPPKGQLKENNDNKHHPHGPHPPRGGPIMGPVGVIYCDLTESEKQQVNQIVESGFSKTKKEVKANMDTFVSGLSSELQAAVTAEKKHFEEMKAKFAEKVKTLSQGAQDLYAKISAVLEDESLTFKENEDKIHEIVEAADKSVVKEFFDNQIPLPGVCPPGPPHQ